VRKIASSATAVPLPAKEATAALFTAIRTDEEEAEEMFADALTM